MLPTRSTALTPLPWRKALAAALAGGLHLPLTGYALGLGSPIGEPVFGQPLRLEVPVLGTPDRPLGTECVAVNRATDPIDGDYYPRDLTVRLEEPRSRSPRLVLATRSSLRQPIVEFRLSVGCEHSVARDYVMLVALPSGPPEAAPANARTADGSAAAGGRALPDGMSARTVRLDREMTLAALGRMHFHGQPQRRERFMRWVVEANPLHFAGAAGDLREHRLGAGLQLLIPEGIPPRRAGEHQSSASPGVELKVPGAPAPATTGTARSAAGQPRPDRLVVAKRPAAVSQQELKEAMALLERLTGVVQQQLANQEGTEEKTRRLESELASLAKQVGQLEANARQREARLQAQWLEERQALEARAEQNWWQLLAAIGGGGMAGALLLQAYRAAAARRERLVAQNPMPGMTLLRVDHAPSVVPSPATASEPEPAKPRPVPAPEAGSLVQSAAALAEQESALVFEMDAPAVEASPKAAAGRAVTVRRTPVPEPQPAHAVDPTEAALELVDIMASMGLTEAAAKTLVAQIRENPRQSLHYWLKLLELYQASGHQDQFRDSAVEMRKYFNVRARSWEGGPAAQERSLEDFPHIRARITGSWRQPDCIDYLYTLLTDSRNGERAGFPETVAEEILLLIAIQSGAV